MSALYDRQLDSEPLPGESITDAFIRALLGSIAKCLDSSGCPLTSEQLAVLASVRSVPPPVPTG
jgi:hypothetical protein